MTPLRLPGFRNLFFATLCSSAGTLLAAVALAIDVQDRTNSGPWVAAVVVVEFLPTVVVGLLFGPLLDRLERRSLMIAADAVRIGVFAALPFAPSAGAVVALAELIASLRHTGCRWLDLGPSASESTLNAGVMLFKEGLGGVGYCRSQWSWTASP